MNTKIAAALFLATCIPSAYGTPINYMHDKALVHLAAWPEQKPNVPLNKDTSMFINHDPLGAILHGDLKLIIELGSWLGASTRFILDNAPNACVIAIDHWKGSEEHFGEARYATKLPTLYETFLVNCWEYKNRLIPLRMTTIEGMELVAKFNLKPDLIYVDASHDYESVMQDLVVAHRLFPNALLCGDDWRWSAPNAHTNPAGVLPVRRAVEDFAKAHNFRPEPYFNFWALIKQP